MIIHRKTLLYTKITILLWFDHDKTDDTVEIKISNKPSVWSASGPVSLWPEIETGKERESSSTVGLTGVS